MHILFFLTACVSIFAVVLICVFLFANGIPAIGKIGVFKFLLGTKWKPGNDIYGILPMILGSLYVTAGAIIIGVPIGLLTAVFLAKFCPKGLYKILKPATELMAGVPSVVYGFFGLVVLVPLVQNIFGVAGNTMLTASVLLGIMILPTIIGVSESAIRAVPDSYYVKALWRSARVMSAACSLRHCRRRVPAFWRVWCSASAVPSAKRWRSSWWRATRRVCRRACSMACAP